MGPNADRLQKCVSLPFGVGVSCPQENIWLFNGRVFITELVPETSLDFREKLRVSPRTILKISSAVDTSVSENFT